MGALLPPSYFASFAGFDADPTAGLIAEFNRLAVAQDWDKAGEEYRHQRARAAVNQFAIYFGTSESRLEGWQAMCRTVGIAEEKIPPSIKKCKQLLKPIHVNIFDLIDSAVTGNVPTIFPSPAALAKNAKRRKKVFAKQEAKENHLLKAMLRKLF